MLAPGSWIHSRRPLKWLLDAGHDVVFVDKEKPEIEESEKFVYIPYPHSRGKRFYSWIGTKITSYITNWTKIVGLKIIQLKNKPDVTHVHWLNYRAYHAVSAKIHPLVVSVLGSDVNRFFERKYSKEEKIIVEKVLQKADLVLVDSLDMIEKCRTLSNEKVNVILFPIGIDTKKYSLNFENEVGEWREKLGIEKGAFLITSIRAMSPKYNQHLIVDAFSKALPNFSCPTYLILKSFNSKDNDYVREVKEMISTLRLDSSIKWINKFIPESEMPVFYALSDLLINFPSYDAFPVSFVEAAAAGKPVVTCDLPAYRNTFAEKYFYSVKTENIEALKYALIDFVNDKSIIENFHKTEVVSWIRENFDEDISKRNLIKIYQSLSSDNSEISIDQISQTKAFQ